MGRQPVWAKPWQFLSSALVALEGDFPLLESGRWARKNTDSRKIANAHTSLPSKSSSRCGLQRNSHPYA